MKGTYFYKLSKKLISSRTSQHSAMSDEPYGLSGSFVLTITVLSMKTEMTPRAFLEVYTHSRSIPTCKLYGEVGRKILEQMDAEDLEIEATESYQLWMRELDRRVQYLESREMFQSSMNSAGKGLYSVEYLKGFINGSAEALLAETAYQNWIANQPLSVQNDYFAYLKDEDLPVPDRAVRTQSWTGITLRSWPSLTNVSRAFMRSIVSIVVPQTQREVVYRTPAEMV